ncbi:hypothetical protein [Nonomuraea dietziae]|uniref:hypothetical protein n=1 Tax=Nonomuraea dietziae TaxID=65515 RepID=UPI0031DC2F6C
MGRQLKESRAAGRHRRASGSLPRPHPRAAALGRLIAERLDLLAQESAASTSRSLHPAN